MRWAEHVARMGRGKVFLLGLVGKTEGKTTLGRPRRRWEDNIKMELQKVGCEGMDCSMCLRIRTGGRHL